jgi:hypothetical protein
MPSTRDAVAFCSASIRESMFRSILCSVMVCKNTPAYGHRTMTGGWPIFALPPKGLGGWPNLCITTNRGCLTLRGFRRVSTTDACIMRPSLPQLSPRASFTRTQPRSPSAWCRKLLYAHCWFEHQSALDRRIAVHVAQFFYSLLLAA